MKSRRHPPPIPWWLSIPGLFLQGVGIFLLPFMVGLVAALFFEVNEVIETLPALVGFTLVVLFPVSLAQLLGVLLKSRRELRYWHKQGQLTLPRLLSVLYNHLRVVTLRGWTVLFSGLLFTLIALAAKWASFGLIATLGLFLFYIVVGWTVFTSTFLVHTFNRGLGRHTTGITRQMIPAVVTAGQWVEEVFTLKRVPVPWGYVLLIEDPLSPRLGTESRYALTPMQSSGETEIRGRIRRTPRGHYFLGPAQIWYQDLLGITRVSIASIATSELKVLPTLKPVEIIEPPRTRNDSPDVLTRPHRFATEDYFRFREYAHGDDTRRIHWRLSLKTGKLQVRQPETKEMSTENVLLVLDTFLPNGRLLAAADGADEILDALVDAWLGIARELVSRGDRVTLLSAATGHKKDEVEIETIPVRKGQVARWQDLGARAHWQSDFDLPELLAHCGDDLHGVVVTSRFTSAPPELRAGQSLTWLFMDPADALGPRDPHWMWETIGAENSWIGALDRFFRLPHPVGSEDNSVVRRLGATWKRYLRYDARRILRAVAVYRAGQTRAELEQRGDAVYQIERSRTHIVLRGRAAQRKRT